jgi:putative transposase
MNKAYKFRIYPNKAQEELIQKTFGCVRFVYNYFLADRKEAYETSKESRTMFQQNKALTALKQEHEWMQEPDKNALQYALRDLNTAYQNFFRNVKKGVNPGFPKFKSKKNDRKSYSTTGYDGKTRVEGNKIRFPKLGAVKASISRQIPESHRIITATISQNASGKYFASLLTEYDYTPPEAQIHPENCLGLDYSSPHFYVDSENQTADMPHFYRNAEKKLAREQRKMSKMVKGSNNWKKQKIRVARAYEKARNQRTDWQQKQSTILANKYDMIAVEDIDYQAMGRGLHLAKATNDNGFGQFRSFLAYKMEERGKKLVTIDKWFPSSKTCRFCGAVNSELKLKDRTWDCPSCGEHIERDLNAAINIKNQALSTLGLA